MYKMDKDQYMKLLNESITKAYRKTNKYCINKITKDASKHCVKYECKRIKRSFHTFPVKWNKREQ